RINLGQSFDRTIEEAIAGAKLVIVLWSRQSVDSDWVRAEAAYGLENAKLLPVRIDDAALPLRFIHTQTMAFHSWDGSADHPVFRQLANEIDCFLQRTEGSPSAAGLTTPKIQPAIPPQQTGRRRSKLLIGGGVGI